MTVPDDWRSGCEVGGESTEMVSDVETSAMKVFLPRFATCDVVRTPFL